MSRESTYRVVLRGKLVCQTPLHVGGLGSDADADLPLARDGAGRVYVPGTSLAGALREWCRGAYPHADLIHVWGFQDGDKGHASRVIVADMALEGIRVIEEVRDGVGIDRRRGAAAAGIKYDRAILPRGTELPFALTAEDGDNPLTESMLQALAAALKAGHVHLGAAKTRGLGRVKLEIATFRRFDLKDFQGIIALLRDRNNLPKGERDLVPVAKATTAARLDVRIDWQPDGPLMVKSGADGLNIDMLPLMSGYHGEELAPVLPGSSIKGAFRNRAEQIVRTLLGIRADGGKEFLTDIELPLVEQVFGARGKPGESKLGLGAMSVADCYAKAVVDRMTWDKIADAPAENAHDSLKDAKLEHWSPAFHVAIDRWTGGAADSFLYTVLEPHGVEWNPIEFGIDFRRLFDGREKAGVALVLLVLRDLAAGRLPLGFGTNRGLGAVTVTKISVTPYGVDWLPDAVEIKDGKLTPFVGLLNDAWQQWIDGPKQERPKS